MTYSVQALAKLAGISVRTLHHYDEIGLLSPNRQSNGYRSYGEQELLKLQQILFFRELELPLEKIAEILSKPNFNMTSSLQDHRIQIKNKQKQLTELVRTIDKTLAKISGEGDMADDELFEAFWEKHEKEYAVEAEDRWGNTEAYKQSKERTKHLTKEDYKRMTKDGDTLMKFLAACIDSGAKSIKTQNLIAKHYEGLRTFYDPSPEIYRGLAEMYVQDERFRAYYEKYNPQMANFMHDAMIAYCDKLEAT